MLYTRCIAKYIVRRTAAIVDVATDNVATGAMLCRTTARSSRYISRRCTSKTRHNSAMSLGRDNDRPVRFSIRRNR